MNILIRDNFYKGVMITDREDWGAAGVISDNVNLNFKLNLELRLRVTTK